MSRSPHHSVCGVNTLVLNCKEEVRISAEISVNSGTALQLPSCLKEWSASNPWTFHTSRACTYIPIFWLYIPRLLGSEFEKYFIFECSLDMKSTWVMYQRHSICKIIMILFKLAYTKLRVVITPIYYENSFFCFLLSIWDSRSSRVFSQKKSCLKKFILRIQGVSLDRGFSSDQVTIQTAPSIFFFLFPTI